MSQPSISEDIALRIGVAARALPDTEPARLLRVLDDAVGLPPTAAALDGLTVKSLKAAADGELADIDKESLKHALALLKGEGTDVIEPPPELDPQLDLPGSIRVACASNGGELLDGHFGSCRRFLIYQVAAEDLRLVDCREIDDTTAAARDDRNAYRASLIKDCQVLFVASIGGPAAAKVVKRGIHPIKHPEMGDARVRVAALQQVLADRAPPWLAKVMGQDGDRLARFEHDLEGS